jgi:hypothetical protein
MKHKRKVYTSEQERKYTRKQLNKAYDEHMKRQRKLNEFSSEEDKQKASISAVAEEFKIGRSTLSYYKTHKKDEAKRLNT